MPTELGPSLLRGRGAEPSLCWIQQVPVGGGGGAGPSPCQRHALGLGSGRCPPPAACLSPGHRLCLRAPTQRCFLTKCPSCQGSTRSLPIVPLEVKPPGSTCKNAAEWQERHFIFSSTLGNSRGSFCSDT